MDATAWLTISIIGYSLAGALLIVAVFMFVKMKIPAIIGDLTGKTAARQIQEIREKNKQTGNKLHKPNSFNLERGSLTELVSAASGRSGTTGSVGNVMAHESRRLDRGGETETTSRPTVAGSLPTEVLADETEVLYHETEVLEVGTEVLDDGTEVLDAGTEVLEDGTEVLFDDNGTTVLNPTMELAEEEADVPAVDFNIIKDIKVIHTNEVI